MFVTVRRAERQHKERIMFRILSYPLGTDSPLKWNGFRCGNMVKFHAHRRYYV